MRTTASLPARSGFQRLTNLVLTVVSWKSQRDSTPPPQGGTRPVTGLRAGAAELGEQGKLPDRRERSRAEPHGQLWHSAREVPSWTPQTSAKPFVKQSTLAAEGGE